MFIDRKKELALLNRIYNSQKPELFVLYGRRRVGKTELLKEFIKDKQQIYFMADLNSEKAQLAALSERVLHSLSHLAIDNMAFNTWDAIFKYIAKAASTQRIIIVLDEFQYLCASNQALPSIIQRLWDELLQQTNIMLVLCGSYIGFMENEILASRSPLYGRRTAQYLLQAMSFFNIKGFFPGFNLIELIETYAVLGGIPAYLKKFDPQLSVHENIKNQILSPESYLHNEVKFLLMQELREVRNYFSILQQIADGQTKLNDVVWKSGLDKGLVSKYVYTLHNLNIIQRETSVDDKNINSRKGLYKIKDNYTDFWFRYVFPHESILEELGADYVMDHKIKDYFALLVSKTFEAICMDYLRIINSKQALPFQFEKIGRWWDASEEIDILAYNKYCVLACECKWQDRKQVGLDLYLGLMEKSRKCRSFEGKKWFYAFFSKCGFKENLKKEAKINSSLLLFDLDDLQKELIDA